MEKVLQKTLKGGRFKNVPAARSRTMSKIRGKGNKTTELALRMALVRHGISGWELQKKIGRIRPDFLFEKERLAVFVDGCFWHGCSRCNNSKPKTNRSYWNEKISSNKARDQRNKRALNRAGFVVMRIWEHELTKNVESKLHQLENTLEKQRGRVVPNKYCTKHNR